MTVAVVTDSTSDIPSEVAEELGITIIPLYVQFGKESYRDNVDLTKGEFFDRLMQDADYPKTSTPNINDFVTTYTEIAKKTKDIISIHLGSGISGTYNVAVAAVKEVEADCRIELVDSRSVIMGLGLMVIEAAKAAKEGMSLNQLTDMVRELVPKTHALLTFDTIKYLYRGGHASKTQVLLGSALRVNPLVEVKNELLPYGRAVGRKRAINALCKYASQFSNPRSLAVEYYLDAEDAKSLVGRLEQVFPGVPIYTSTVGVVVGAHTGPHVLNVAIVEK